MPLTHPARSAATRGSLSARQWQDIRQAARLARSEGVTLIIHGVKIFGDTPAGSRQPQRDAVHDGGDQQPMEVDRQAAAAATKNKKQQRDALRAQENRVRKRMACWRRLVLRMTIRPQRDAVWTEWMRSRMSPKCDARSRVRDAFWQEWTRPQFAGGSAARLGLMSHRDRYILGRADALMDRYFPELTNKEHEDQMLQAAIQASLMTMPAETRGSSHTHATRSLDEAEIKTPASTRRGGKKHGGRRS